MSKNIRLELKKFWKGDIDDREEALEQYSHDASLLEVKPEIILYPKDTQDVRNIVKWVEAHKDMYPNLAITARCAGTDMSGGAIGESIVLDFTRYMNKLIGGPLPLDKNSYYISVEPGMYYRDFEKITLAKGLILPCYTASKSLNALGGMYGNNSAGERTLKYGKMENFVLSAKVVLADGEEYEVKPLSKTELEKKISQKDFEGEMYKKIYSLIIENEDELKHAKPKVSKNSSGYTVWNVLNQENESSYFDLNKLLVGSQGTLGIVTELTIKLIPENKYSKLVAIFMDDLAPLGRLVDEILIENPETLETYDSKTMKLAVKFFFDFLKNKGWKGMLKFMWSFLPEFRMMLKNIFGGQGFPKLIILAEFAGENEADVHAKCEKLAKRIKHFNLKVHITESQVEAEKYWDIRRQSFALLRKHVKGMRTAPFIDDIIVRPEFLPKFIPELNKILGQYDIMFTLAGHAGDGNFHIIPLMDFNRKDTSKIILNLSEQVYDLVARYRGSNSAEHNDGLIRTPYLGKMYSARILEIFKEIKHTFDPRNILNPGKKVPLGKQGGTKEYIAAHIAAEHSAHHSV